MRKRKLSCFTSGLAPDLNNPRQCSCKILAARPNAGNPLPNSTRMFRSVPPSPSAASRKTPAGQAAPRTSSSSTCALCCSEREWEPPPPWAAGTCPASARFTDTSSRAPARPKPRCVSLTATGPCGSKPRVGVVFCLPFQTGGVVLGVGCPLSTTAAMDVNDNQQDNQVAAWVSRKEDVNGDRDKPPAAV